MSIKSSDEKQKLVEIVAGKVFSLLQKSDDFGTAIEEGISEIAKAYSVTRVLFWKVQDDCLLVKHESDGSGSQKYVGATIDCNSAMNLVLEFLALNPDDVRKSVVHVSRNGHEKGWKPLFSKFEDANSHLCVPLAARNIFTGFIDLQYSTDLDESFVDYDQLITIGSLFSVLLNHKFEYSNIEFDLEEMRTCLEIDDIFAHEKFQEAVVKSANKIASNACYADNLVYLYSQPSKTLVPQSVSTVDWINIIDGKTIELMFTSGSAETINSDTLKLSKPSAVLGPILLLPLVVGDSKLGILCLWNYFGKRSTPNVEHVKATSQRLASSVHANQPSQVENLPTDPFDLKISKSYPYPPAYCYRTVRSIVNPVERYQELLRVSENLLAFLSSLSLALLKPDDLINIDPLVMAGGISPGHWRDFLHTSGKTFGNV